MERNSRIASPEEVISAWLKDEWHYSFFNPIRTSENEKMVMYPDLSSNEENAWRLKVLSNNRKDILDEIPKDTKWFEIDFTSPDINHTYLIAASWCRQLTNGTCRLSEACISLSEKLSLFSKNDTEKIQGIRTSLLKNKHFSKRLIFIAPELGAPQVVIEGNHRIIAIAEHSMRGEKNGLLGRVYIGISTKMKQSKLYEHISQEYI